MSETPLQQRLMLHYSESGIRLFRNNCGQLQTPAGAWVRYGVANPGGSDLIGWTPMLLTEAHVGRTVAVFTAVETKVGRRGLTVEQSRFLHAVRLVGGLAVVAREVEDVETELSRFLKV